MDKKVLKMLLELAADDKSEGVSTSELPFEIGGSYLFRTVTYFLLGKVKEIKGSFIELEKASWVADTGRFNEAISKGSLSEVETVAVPVWLNASSIVDVFEWTHALPKESK